MEKEVKLLNSMHAYVRDTEKLRRGSTMGGLSTLADDPEVRLVCALRDLRDLVIKVALAESLADITSEEAS
jgi:hypothetical protein